MSQMNLDTPRLLAALLCTSVILGIGCGDQQEDDAVNPNCSSESWQTCRVQDGCMPVNSTLYDDERGCVDRSLKFCLNSGDPHPEMDYTPTEQIISVTDPDGNCWQFSGFYPQNWTQRIGSVCVRPYSNVSCPDES